MNNLVKSTLSPLNVPIAKLRYLGGESPYIVFSYWEVPYAHADDVEIETEYTIQIDVFTKGNPETLADNARELMKNAGFMKVFENEDYVEDLQLYRKIMRFNYQAKTTQN
ncbi:hypothetical protein [Halobacillus aidingensis]|uniref:Uncharacterized protein n=1 Tax=Halobacillus aidingensis TaxID=240303 RepID=A0A1H0MFL0_HALAD|nr:hypothetical protein [Halobacillus aidingensis]SDO79262.1 hypothetical protein SAMN05421677_10823 [Halobacillus aidingensis]